MAGKFTIFKLVNFTVLNLGCNIFQMDMHELIDEQMKKQLNDNMQKPKPTQLASVTKRTTNRFMGLFQR